MWIGWLSAGEVELNSSRRLRRRQRARARAASARLHLQFPRPADPRHPRRADHRRPQAHRHRVRRHRRARLRAPLFGPRSAARDACRPHQPQRVIAGALAVWSGFTALCGLRQLFWQLFLFRLGVGVGEAGGVAPSYALIADYFPPERRARALAIFSLGIPLGLAAGTLIGAYIATAVDWRAAFIVDGRRRASCSPRSCAISSATCPRAKSAAASGAARSRYSRCSRASPPSGCWPSAASSSSLCRLRPRVVGSFGARAQLRHRPDLDRQISCLAPADRRHRRVFSPEAGSPTASAAPTGAGTPGCRRSPG